VLALLIEIISALVVIEVQEASGSNLDHHYVDIQAPHLSNYLLP
jgi:hypothetical protein